MLAALAALAVVLASSKPVVRVFFNETAPSDKTLLWLRFAPSLARDNIDIRFGGGSDPASVAALARDDDEAVVVALESGASERLLASRKAVVWVQRRDDFPAPFSLQLLPSLPALLAMARAFLAARSYTRCVLLPAPTPDFDAFDAAIATDVSPASLAALRRLDPRVPAVVIPPFDDARLPGFLDALAGRPQTFFLAPTADSGAGRRVEAVAVSYPAVIYDAMLVATQGAVGDNASWQTSPQHNTSSETLRGPITQQQQEEERKGERKDKQQQQDKQEEEKTRRARRVERMFANQYNGMSGLFSFVGDGRRDKFRYGLFATAPPHPCVAELTDAGALVHDERALPVRRSRALPAALGAAGAALLLAALLAAAAAAVLLARRLRLRIPVRAVTLTLPPLAATAHAKTYFGVWRLRKVCVKVLAAPCPPHAARRDIRRLARLRSPRLVRVLGGSADPPAIVTAFAERESLRHCVESHDPVVAERRLAILKDVLLGLRFLHARRVLHLNLTPANVLLDRDGRALLADMAFSAFSSAKPPPVAAWRKARVRFAPPELLEGRPGDARSDVYMFGMVVWFVECEEAPFAWATDRDELVRAVCDGRQPGGALVGEDVRPVYARAVGPPAARPSVEAVLQEPVFANCAVE